MARPSKYDPKFNKQVYKLALLGATDEEMADIFEIDKRTFHRWKKDHDGFCHSIKKGKLIADAKVSERLFKRACGFAYNELTYEPKKSVNYKDGKRETMDFDYTKLVLTKKVKKEIVPDTGAAFIWLKNRQPDKWRDRPDERSNQNRLIVGGFNYKVINAN